MFISHYAERRRTRKCITVNLPNRNCDIRFSNGLEVAVNPTFFRSRMPSCNFIGYFLKKLVKKKKKKNLALQNGSFERRLYV